jgi:ketosteroid isomerase-like protein
MKKITSIAISLLLIIACTVHPDREALKKKVYETEKAFETMAAGKGIAEAFVHFAAEDAVIKRMNDSIISGKNAIRDYYSRAELQNATVNWSPDYISVSGDGTMAWTYGRFSWKVVRENGDTVVSKGIFHTVWERQEDNSWRYVWD